MDYKSHQFFGRGNRWLAKQRSASLTIVRINSGEEKLAGLEEFLSGKEQDIFLCKEGEHYWWLISGCIAVSSTATQEIWSSLVVDKINVDVEFLRVHGAREKNQLRRMATLNSLLKG